MSEPPRKEDPERTENNDPPPSDTEGRRDIHRGVERVPIEGQPIDEGEDIDEGIPIADAAVSGLDDED